VNNVVILVILHLSVVITARHRGWLEARHERQRRENPLSSSDDGGLHSVRLLRHSAIRALTRISGHGSGVFNKRSRCVLRPSAAKRLAGVPPRTSAPTEGSHF
jgi:hypothetical protein